MPLAKKKREENELPAQEDGPAARVLIVDDDPALLEVLPEMLRLRMPGIAIDVADSGARALRRLKKTDYDVVICDIKMPGMDGLVVLHKISQLRPKTPTIMITGHGEHDLALLALRGGAYDFIQKPIDRDYFVASLQRAIDMHGLSRQVDEQQQALEQHARQLQDIVDERTRELRESNDAKDRFLAILAHELRNPLAPIHHAVELLQMDELPVPAHKACEIIRRQVGHIANLLDDLLDISRIQHGKVKLSRRPVSLGPTIDHAIEASMPLFRNFGHDLRIQVSEPDLCVDADPTRIEQIVGNLLNNAAKYTEPGGDISLTVGSEDGKAVIRVKDNGIGIAPELISRIFDLFAQAEQSLDRSQGGLGIGLTLVRHLVQMHDGEVQVFSEGPDRGSEFVVRLPLHSRTSAEALPPSTTAGKSGATSQRILVIEDNADSRLMLGELLRLCGHSPDLAADGHEGVEAARRSPPDVALVDIGLPGIDGYEVARQIRAMPENGSTYLIALTGYGQPDDRRRSREAGFDAHIVKPVKMDDLLGMLTANRSVSC